MQRFWLIAGVAVVIVGLLWLAEDGGVGQRLIDFAPDNTAAAPSWGDVANKVGEFAREEEDLKAAIGAVQNNGEPTP